MKVITYVFIFLVSLKLQSQNLIDFRYNLDVYVPYTENAQDYMNKNDSFKNFSFDFNYNRKVYSKNRHNLMVGLSYKFIYLKVVDKVKFVLANDNSSPEYFYYPKKYDLINKSNSFGLNLSYSYDLKRKKVFGNVYLGSTFYLYEVYKSRYKTKEKEPLWLNIYKPSSIDGWFDQFLSSINLKFGYTQHVIKKEHFSLSAVAHIGTNLYSDWDLFRKYVWLGVGLEMGFGKGKAIFGKKSE